MNAHNCILLSDDREKLNFWDSYFAREAALPNVVFSSCAEEDPEELCLLYHPDIVILDVETSHDDLVAAINRYLSCSSDVRVIAFTNYTQFSFDSSFLHLQRTHFLPRPVSPAAMH